MEILTSESRLMELRCQKDLLVVLYGAQDCGPCKALKGKLELWEKEHSYASCLYIPTESFPALAAQAGIFTVPVIQVYVVGRKTIQEGGCFSLESILNQIEQYHGLMQNSPRLYEQI